MKKTLNVLLIVLICLIALPQGVASAHAVPVQSIPAANEALERSPAQIEIFFSEALESSYSYIEVYDANGSRVDNNDARVSPSDATHLTVTMPSSPDGVYTVVWRVLSAVDGHITAGSFPFAVGDVDAAQLAAAQASQQIRVSPLDIASRWFMLIGSLLLTGSLAFMGLGWQRAEPQANAQTEIDRLWRVVSITAAVVFLAANLFNMMVQAGAATGIEIAAPWSADFSDVFFTTRAGIIVLARLVLTLVLLILLLAPKLKNRQWFALGVSVIILLTLSITSHSAAAAEPLLPVLLDWLHITAAGWWVGGVLYFGLTVWRLRKLPATDRAQLLARLIPRFTVGAVGSVVLLTATGVYSAITHIGKLENLTTTAYGITFLIKMALIAPMLLLGFVNMQIVTRRMQSAAEGSDAEVSAKPVNLFRSTITVEMVLGVILLLSVAVLTTLPPAESNAKPPALTDSGAADDLEVELNVTPGRVGVNTFTLTVTRDGQPVDDASEVRLKFEPTTSSLPPTEVELDNVGDGNYSVEGAYFSLPAVWQVQPVVRRDDAFDAYANLSFNLGSAQNTSRTPWPRFAAALMVVLAVAYVFVWRAISPTPRQAVLWSVPTTAVLALSGLVLLLQPIPVEPAAVVNPIPPNQESIAAGEALYQGNCIPCHGETGKGDGPVGRTLNPPPADLTAHTAPGVHADGQLYAWISDGFPGSQIMPAFRTILSDEDRWNLVNYIRTLPQTKR